MLDQRLKRQANIINSIGCTSHVGITAVSCYNYVSHVYSNNYKSVVHISTHGLATTHNFTGGGGGYINTHSDSTLI